MSETDSNSGEAGYVNGTAKELTGVFTAAFTEAAALYPHTRIGDQHLHFGDGINFLACDGLGTGRLSVTSGRTIHPKHPDDEPGEHPREYPRIFVGEQVVVKLNGEDSVAYASWEWRVAAKGKDPVFIPRSGGIIVGEAAVRKSAALSRKVITAAKNLTHH